MTAFIIMVGGAVLFSLTLFVIISTQEQGSYMFDRRQLPPPRQGPPAEGHARYIADLEHDGNEYVPAVAPLGKDPDHCPECRRVVAQRARRAEIEARQAACRHIHTESVDIRTFCDPTPRQLWHCIDCGKAL